ncbi:MAG: hypothetical protein AB1659_08810 [Thermodesulfobacteriota bacterium]
MNNPLQLLTPRLWSLKNSILSKNEGNKRILKPILLAGIGALFWSGIFLISIRVLSYFRGIEEIGDLLSVKLLSMMFVIFFSLLIFSGILTHLSKLYLSKDLPLVHSLPVPSHEIFISRWLEGTFDSAWMVLIYALPILISYGIVYQASLLFYAFIPMILFPMIVMASGISAVLVMAAVLLIPASRIRSLFVFFGLSVFIIIYVAFRMLRPERLVDPEAFSTIFVYLNSMRTPASPYLPSTWALDGVMGMLHGNSMDALMNLAISASGAFTIFFFQVILSDRIYFKGLSKAQSGRELFFKRKNRIRAEIRGFSGPAPAIAVKEIKTFLRDQTQWSQVFLISALVIIYIYNFKVLPLEKSPIQTVYLQNLLSFLNMGLVSFVLIAITARFAYPAVGMEKEAFWLIRSTPICLKSFLWIKFMIYFIPLLVLSEILVVATNILLKVTPFIMWLSAVTVFLMVPGIVSMGIGIGAIYPDFKSENPAQSVTSWGGLVFMMTGAVFVAAVIMLEAGPVYRLFMADLKGHGMNFIDWAWTAISFSGVLILSLSAVFFPMHLGGKRLESSEY